MRGPSHGGGCLTVAFEWQLFTGVSGGGLPLVSGRLSQFLPCEDETSGQGAQVKVGASAG